MKTLATLLCSFLCFTASAKDYYVYHLIDPRTGEVFYVGKGSGIRMTQHEVEANRPKARYSEKEQTIRDIQSQGLRVKRRVVRSFDCEGDAYEFERNEISRVGKRNLTNVYNGVRNSREKC